MGNLSYITILRIYAFNPLISTTPSKPLMSSGSWFHLHYCEIYYLSAVSYDPASIDIIFIRVNITQGLGWGTNRSFLNPFICQGRYLPCCLTYNIIRGHYLPRKSGEGAYIWFFSTLIFEGLLFTLWPYTTILAVVTVYPARFAAIFGLYQDH